MGCVYLNYRHSMIEETQESRKFNRPIYLIWLCGTPVFSVRLAELSLKLGESNI